MKTILVVDDEYDFNRALAVVLTLEDYTVRSAHDGRAALADISAQLPDLILLDIMMPTLSGMDVLSALGQDPATARIPVILMSGAQPPALNGLGEQVTFLQKPFRFDELSALISKKLP